IAIYRNLRDFTFIFPIRITKSLSSLPQPSKSSLYPFTLMKSDFQYDTLQPLKLELYACFTVYNLDNKGKRSEEHTSELQSRENLVCRLLLEKKKRDTS